MASGSLRGALYFYVEEILLFSAVLMISDTESPQKPAGFGPCLTNACSLLYVFVCLCLLLPVLDIVLGATNTSPWLVVNGFILTVVI